MLASELRGRQELGRYPCTAAAALLFAVFLSAPVTLQGQSPVGEIRMQVKDQSGAPMEASGKLESLPSGMTRSFQTDARGTYDLGKPALRPLPAGDFQSRIRHPIRSRSTYSPRRPISRTFTMALGAQTSKVDVVATTPLAGTDLAIDQIAGPVQTATAADIQNSGALDLGGFHEPAPERRVSQRNAGEPVPARREFPRLHRFSAARNARRHLGLSGWRAAKSAVWRRGELGPDSQECDLGDRR